MAARITQNRTSLVLALLLIAFAVTSRLAPHPANVAPMAAVALLGGAVLPRRWALTLPLAAMIISDLFLGIHSLIGFTWGSFALIALIANSRMKHIGVRSVVSASIVASILFFLVTNFGVWLEGRLYAHTLADLFQCYYNALPFFRNTLIGDLAYSGVLFGAYALATNAVGKRRVEAKASSF